MVNDSALILKRFYLLQRELDASAADKAAVMDVFNSMMSKAAILAV